MQSLILQKDNNNLIMESESKHQTTTEQSNNQHINLTSSMGSKFVIPEFGQIKVNPFPNSINKRILISPQFLNPSSIDKTYKVDYIKQFQFISGSENLFPILLQVTTKNIYVCSKDCFVAFPLDQPAKYEKIKLPQMPTCFKASGDFLYFGLKSGSIIIYNIVTKNTVATCEQFDFPVLQIQTVSKEKFLSMDTQGNIKLLTLSFKTFMERVVKISSNASFIVKQFSIKKRDKFKNFVKNLPFRKQKDKIQQPEPKLNSEQEGEGNINEKEMSKFVILPQALRRQQTFPLIYYHSGQLKSLTLDKKLNKIAEFTILENQKGLGMMELGEGAFQNSNQAHIVLVISIEKIVYFYRQINVQKCLQFIQISKKQHESVIHNGKFISNNLLIFLTQSGIQISNVNGPMELVHRINYQKFSYIDFFNQEQGFNFDKRLLYPNILKIGNELNGNGLWCCLEGKRILLGNILSWKNYLSIMADEYQWQKCMKCALMIYKDEITLLGGVPESLQERNQTMRQMFEKITLSYLSYSLKNIENLFYRKKILKNAIDFLVRTESFNYLFTTVFQVAKGYGLEQVFISELEQYIQSGSIKQITEEILLKIIDHYTLKQDIEESLKEDSKKQKEGSKMQDQEIQKKQIGLVPKKSQQEIEYEIKKTENRQHLQTMIMNFNLDKIEKPLILTICLNNELYRSLIHICREQADYITPILKLCGLRIVKMADLQKLQNERKKQKQGDGENETNALQWHKIIHLQEELQKIAQITFYYLYECLMGHMTEHNNTKAYVQMLQQVIGFIFIPSTLIMLIQASSRLSFKLFNVVFGAQVMQYILQNEDTITIKNCKYLTTATSGVEDISQLVSKQISICTYRYAGGSIKERERKENDYSIFNHHSSSEQFGIYNKMLTIITQTVMQNYNLYHEDHVISTLADKMLFHNQELEEFKFSDREQSQLYLHQCLQFIAYLLLSNSFPIRLGYRILVFQFMIVYPHTFNSHAQEGNFQDERAQQITNSTIMRVVDSIIREINNIISQQHQDQISKAIDKTLQMLIQIIEQLTICRERMDHRKQLLVPIKCYILDKLNRHSELVSALLGSSKQSVRKSVFNYFEQKINKELDTYNYNSNTESINSKIVYTPNSNEMVKLLINNIEQLMHICKERLLILLTSICEKLILCNNINIIEVINIANQLKKQPDLELSFIENMIKAYQKLLYVQEGPSSLNLGLVSKNNEMLAVRHLEAVVAHKKQYLQQYILKMNYPLEQAYKVCEQSNNKTAMAYILIKSGRNLEGVQLICDLFISNSREVFRDLAKNTQTNTTHQLILKMEQQLSKVLQTCSNQHSNDVSRGEQMWEKVSEKLFRQLKPQKVQSIPIVKIKQLLQLYIDKIIKAMFGQVNPEFFVQKFSQNAKMTGIPTKLYLQAHDLVYERLGFKFQINSLTKQLLRQYQMKLYQKLLKEYTEGYALSSEEQVCEKCEGFLIAKNRKNDEKDIEESRPSENICLEKSKILVFGCDHAYHSSCLNEIKEEQKNKGGKNSRKLKSNTCSSCKTQWQNAIYGEMKSEPDKLSSIRERKKSLLIERKNKLAEFDIYGYFKITGEELMRPS